MSILALLSSCTAKNYVRNENGFREINETTPVGKLLIKIVGKSKKIGDREWITDAPWKLVLVLNSDNASEVNGCRVRVENLSLVNEDGTRPSPEVVWEEMEDELSLKDSKAKFPSAILIAEAKSFPHKSYRLTFSLTLLGQCEKSIANHEINVPFVSFSEESRSSLWDNLMGI